MNGMDYSHCYSQVDDLTIGETSSIANCANVASFLYHAFQAYDKTTVHRKYHLNWVGFYFVSPSVCCPYEKRCFSSEEKREKVLLLGPFIGRPACRRIQWNEGVCGKVFRTSQIEIVGDVHTFPGHIVCDAASQSEMAIPLVIKKQVVAIADFDSSHRETFTAEDAEGLNRSMELLAKRCHWHTME